MTASARFTTLRIGTIAPAGVAGDFVFDVRVLADSEGHYRLFDGELSEPLPAIQDAVDRAESLSTVSPESPCVVWRENLSHLSGGEHFCPICNAPVRTPLGYPGALCPACVLEATSPSGKPLRFNNLSLSGGLEVRVSESGSTQGPTDCYVRGVLCRAEELRFGGFALQPIEKPSGKETA